MSEQEALRGVSDEQLPRLTNEQLLMVALAALFGALGYEDDRLVDALITRGRPR